MIVRKTNSQRVPPCSARESRPAASTGAGRDNPHKVARHDRVIAAQLSNNFRHDLPNQPGIIALVGVNGGVEPFHFIDHRPFHDGRTSRVRQK